jgi:glycerol-3-phosphate dehydrogenase
MSNLSTQLLVIGGGATGLGIALDACLRGIKTVLVDRCDLSQGTSGRYHGLLHSGGRYVLSDPQAAAACASENILLRKIAAPAIEDTGGYFVSTPGDSLEFPDLWLAACRRVGVPCEERSSQQLRHREPLLNPRISRAFEVQDASLDSFDLAHMLAHGIRDAGGKILLHHEVTDLVLKAGQLEFVRLLDRQSHKRVSIGADFIVNAAGPWSEMIAHMVNIKLPISLSKGTMLAMASRLTNTVINRCKSPGDGDIIVPVGTVCVLGTTDSPVNNPEDVNVLPWEIDLLLSEADLLIPGIQQHRPLRTWAGVRPLYDEAVSREPNRKRIITREHIVLDHRETDGVDHFVTVFGGKLTTYRLMAEEAVSLIANRLGNTVPCSTASATLPSPETNKYFALPGRLSLLAGDASPVKEMIICECELVTDEQIKRALNAESSPTLDDIRRDLRLGMGPCQAAYCAFRAAGIASLLEKSPPDFLTDFAKERWKGIRSLTWGVSMQQIEIMRRIYSELLHLPRDTDQ